MTLEGYWPLHDDSATDYSGNDNHGTLNGGVTTGVAGRGGLEAMSFDGTDDYIQQPQSLDATGGYTATLVVRTPSTLPSSEERIYTHANGGTFAIRIMGDGTIDAIHQTSGGFQYVSGISVSSSTWYRVAVSWDGSQVSLYVNEASNSISASSINVQSSSNTNDIGRRGVAGDSGTTYNDLHFEGVVSDFRFYSRALAASEIQTLYEWGSLDLARPPTDGVSRYALDGDATDAWGSNDATNNGAMFTSNAIRSQAASFDGSSNIQTPISDTYSTFTWSYWVNPDNSGVNSEAYVSTRSSASGAGSRQRNGNLDFYAYDSDNGSFTQVDSGVTVTAGEWYHVVGVVSSSEIQVYVNGTLKSAKSFGTYGNGPEVWLGEQPGGGINAEADIDDVRIYDYALSPSEIHELYRWGTRGKDLRKHLVNRRQK